VILTIAESFDSTTLSRVDEAITKILDHHRESVILNLYECEYIDEAALGRLVEFGHILRDQGRICEVYVRPMSFVGFRTQGLPQVAQVPEAFARIGEERLAERRSERLEKWRKEKPLPVGAPPEMAPKVEHSSTAKGTKQKKDPVGGERDLFDIDLHRVSTLAGKDERVIERIWKTYTEFLNEGKFKTAPDGSADTQMTLDANVVAQSLRLDPKVVRRVIESVSTHLMEVFDSE
jgi:anti-anti-sigma regulatory factor